MGSLPRAQAYITDTHLHLRSIVSWGLFDLSIARAPELISSLLGLLFNLIGSRCLCRSEQSPVNDKVGLCTDWPVMTSMAAKLTYVTCRADIYVSLIILVAAPRGSFLPVGI